MYYTNNQICHVFGISRDDVNRLCKASVINPEVLGQGIASMYSEADMDILLMVKVYLMAGYKISDMEDIFTKEKASEKTSDERIAKQIRKYKRRIRLLEFIQAMRLNFNKTRMLSVEQQANTIIVQNENFEMPEYNSNEYQALTWEIIQLVFILDYLCQEESLSDDGKEVANKIKAVLITVRKLIVMKGLDINEARKDFIEFGNTSFNDQEIKEASNEVYEYIVANKEKIIDALMQSNSDPVTSKLDDQSGSVYRDRMKILNEFLVDYFFDAEAMVCLITNFLRFFNEIDKDALKEGEIKLIGEGGKKRKRKQSNYLE